MSTEPALLDVDSFDSTAEISWRTSCPCPRHGNKQKK